MSLFFPVGQHKMTIFQLGTSQVCVLESGFCTKVKPDLVTNRAVSGEGSFGCF